MSVRVNLLPREFEERSRQRRMLLLGALVVAAYTALLAVVLLGRLSAIQTAEDTRNQAQAEVNELQGQVASLAAFQSLAAQLAAGNEVLTAAMANEVSWAQLLNDVALTIPSTTSLTSLTGSIEALPQGQLSSTGVFVDDDRGAIGVLSISGYTVDKVAPGVEAVLLRFGEVDNFFQQYLNTAAEAQISDVAVFNFAADVRLSQDLRTGRYLDGLPGRNQ